MGKIEIKVNPFSGAMEALPSTELEERGKRTGRLLSEKGLAVAIFDMALEGNGRWFRNSPVVGKPAAEYLVVTPEGNAYVSSGYHIGKLEKKKANMGNPMAVQEAEEVRTLDELCRGGRKIGYVCPNRMKAAAREEILKIIPDAVFVDISREFWEMKAVKSKVEHKIMEYVVRQHDKVMSCVAGMLNVGRTEPMIVSEIRYKAYQNGGSGFSIGRQVHVRMISNPQKADLKEEHVYYPGRELRNGDIVSVSLQSVGNSGYYGSIGRSFAVGEVEEETAKAWAVTVGAQHRAAENMAPGKKLSEVRQAVEEYLAGEGYELNGNVFISSIGYIYPEPPYLIPAMEDMILQEGMILSVGPEILDAHQFPYLCQDMYVIEERGARRLSRLDQELKIV